MSFPCSEKLLSIPGLWPTCLTAVFPAEPGPAGWLSSSTWSRREPFYFFTDMASFHLPVTQPKVSKGTQSTEPTKEKKSPQPFFICRWLPREGALLPSRWYSDASTVKSCTLSSFTQ